MTFSRSAIIFAVSGLLAVWPGGLIGGLSGTGATANETSLAHAGRAWADAGFVTGFDDVPLMPGLRQSPDDSVVFDTAQGRLAEGLARGALTALEVRQFYRATLPQLGWTQTARASAADTFKREGEALTIAISQTSSGLSVRFRLVPDPAAGR